MSTARHRQITLMFTLFPQHKQLCAHLLLRSCHRARAVCRGFHRRRPRKDSHARTVYVEIKCKQEAAKEGPVCVNANKSISPTVRPSRGPTCQRIGVLRDSPLPCHQSPCASCAGSIIWRLTASILPPSAQQNILNPCQRESEREREIDGALDGRREREKAVHPELPSVYGDAFFFFVFFFPSASAFYVSSRKCPRTFVLWLRSGGSFCRVSSLRAEIRGCDAVQNANAKQNCM